MLCLGIDSGTGSSNALMLDIESGEFIALAQRNYGTIERLPPEDVEQEPKSWTEAAGETSPNASTRSENDDRDQSERGQRLVARPSYPHLAGKLKTARYL